MDNSEAFLGQVVPFKYAGGQTVRAVRGEHGEVWFAMNDLCEILGLASARRAAERLDSDEIMEAKVHTPRGAQYMRVVNRSGMYHLVLTSRVPEAVRLRQWVTRDVLPAIEEHGVYATDEWKADLANNVAMIRGTLKSAARSVAAGKTQVALESIAQVEREFVSGNLVGILGGPEAYRALL